MKLFVFTILVCLVAAVAAKHCQGTIDCTHDCPDGYHEQCVNSQCTCPAHTCSAASDCPQGGGSGCPPFCTTSCDSSSCKCHCSNTSQ